MTSEPMVKMMILAPRRETMTHAQFRDYVTNTHGPLVKSIPEVAAGIRRYHYNFPIPGATDELFGHPLASADYDIVTQAWFDSLAAHRANQSHARYWSVIRPDEEVMADNARALFHFMREQVIIPGEVGATKLFVMRARRDGLSRGDFQAAWHERTAAALDKYGSTGLARYVQNHALPEADYPEGGKPGYFDLIDEYVLVPGAAATIDPDLRAELAAIAAEFTDGTRTRSFVAETVRNIDGPVW
ncbi:MAG: EthD domain-containing protein [Sphingomicrobium sp.]